jgi:hypothetical protein
LIGLVSAVLFPLSRTAAVGSFPEMRSSSFVVLSFAFDVAQPLAGAKVAGHVIG